MRTPDRRTRPWHLLTHAVLVSGVPTSRRQGGDEETFRTFFERSDHPILVLDGSHMIVDSNDAASRFFGLSPRRLRGALVLEVDLLARILTAGSILQRIKSDPPPVVDEVRIADSEGQSLQVRVEAVPVSANRVVIQLEDTTQVMRAREATRAAERLYHAMIDSLPDVAWAMALPEERLVEVSPSVEKLFGYQPSELREQPDTWIELVHPADRERVRSEFRRGLTARRPFELRFTGLRKDHTDVPHLVNHVVPVIDERGWMDRCEGFITDESTRHRLEDGLNFAEATLRHALDSVSSGVLVLAPGPEGPRIVTCSRRLADLLRLEHCPKPGTLLHRAPEALRTLATDGDTESALEKRLLSEDTQEGISEFQDPRRVLRRYAGPVRDQYGAVIAHLVSAEDVTASWLLQQRLTHAQKMESMGRLAGGVAHDFNNLLGSILGFSSLVLEDTPADDPRRESLQQIATAAERATQLTAALLAFSRGARFERMPVQLNTVLNDSYQLLRSTLEPSVVIDYRLAPQLPPLLGDAQLLQQVIVSLAQEAQDDIGHAGSVRFTTRVIESTGADAPHTVELAIEAAPAARGAVAADPATPAFSTRPDRAGLALTIAEDITRAHGGMLLRGEAAAPALFRITLPVNALEEEPAIVPATPEAQGHERVLVVDDEPGLRTLAKIGLMQRGFEVVTSASGEEALALLEAGIPHIDAVLLDLSMPGLSGERVLRTIRTAHGDLPVIIASGYATVESQAAWSAAGAQGFVAKPYRVQDVATKLRDVLDRAKKARA